MPLFFGLLILMLYSFFFFNDTATTEIYTLSLHDALPIFGRIDEVFAGGRLEAPAGSLVMPPLDRKSTRLNSSHVESSYAVFCLTKKNSTTTWSFPARPRASSRAMEATSSVCLSRVLTRGSFGNFTTCFFFNDTATTEIYTLSLHDALPI